MIVVPSPLDVASLALAPQSLLAPLSAVTLLLNALLGAVFLGGFRCCCWGEGVKGTHGRGSESRRSTLTVYDKVATLLIFVGAILSTAFGSIRTTPMTCQV